MASADLCNSGFVQLYQIKIQGLFKTSSQIQELFKTSSQIQGLFNTVKILFLNPVRNASGLFCSKTNQQEKEHWQ